VNARTFRALGDDTRLALLATLRDDGRQRAGDLAARFGHLSRPAVSKHLAVLRAAGLVAESRVGTERWYRLETEPLERLERSFLAPYRDLWTQRPAPWQALTDAQ
jgi:DNA-binding transcriptional ArsR family regulator